MPPGRRRAGPSRSCGNCRAIKRRCDRQLPSCGQCVRMRETCPGYRDEWELVFRDQTDHVIQRSTRNPTKKLPSNQVVVRHVTPPPADPMRPDLDEVGLNYFLQDFVSGGRAAARGYLNYIPTGYNADAEHPTLAASMASVGLAALAVQHRELGGYARAKYGQALGLVHKALASPVDAVRDSTLMSVISLGVFEHVSNFESWAKHVRGAAALVVLRGRSQFSSPAAILMFNQVRADMAAACIQGILPFPDDLRELQDEAAKHADACSVLWRLGVLATQCATYFASVTKNNLAIHESDFIPWPRLLDEVLALQSDFQQALALLSVQDPYTTVLVPDQVGRSVIRNGRYDLYETSWAIRLWNNFRSIEIIVYEIACWLINKVLTTEPALPPQHYLDLEIKRRELLQIMSQRGEDILSSVPQSLGLVPPLEGQTFADSPSHGYVAGGHMLIWSLYTAGKSPVVDDETRQWIAMQLKGISKRSGIAMALQFAEDMVKVDLTAL